MQKIILTFLILSNLAFSEQIGIASHYSVKTNGGTKTASGVPLDDSKFTVAHRHLKMGTLVKITNLKNNKAVVAKVLDRGPYYGNRIVDVSQACAKVLGFHKQGLTKVRLKVVNPPKAVIVKDNPPFNQWLKTKLQSIYENYTNKI